MTLALMCTVALGLTLAACSDSNDDNGGGSVIPDAQFVEKLCAENAWIDRDNADALNSVRGYTFRSGGSMVYAKIQKFDDHDHLVAGHYIGSWKLLSDVNDRWGIVDDNVHVIAVQMRLSEYHFLGSSPNLVNDAPLISDTLFVRSDGSDMKLLWASDLQRLTDAYTTAGAPGYDPAMTRGILSSIWNKVKSVVSSVISSISDAWDYLTSLAADKISEVITTLGSDVVNEINDYLNDKYGNVTTKDISPSQADWMAALPDDMRIADMSIPASHDTYTYNYNEKLGPYTGKTQFYDAETQWNAGIRSFDFRVDYSSSAEALGIFHGPFYLKKTLVGALDDVSSLLSKHPQETCFVIIKFEGNDQYPTDVANEIKKRSYVVNPSPDMTLGDCRGKMICIMRYLPDDDNDWIGIRATDWPTDNEYAELVFDAAGTVSVPFLVQDHYKKFDDEDDDGYISHKKSLMQANFEDAENPAKANTWHVNQLSGYIGTWMNYAKNSNSIIPFASEYISGKQSGSPYGFLIMDFVAYKGTYDSYEVDGTQFLGIVIGNNNK